MALFSLALTSVRSGGCDVELDPPDKNEAIPKTGAPVFLGHRSSKPRPRSRSTARPQGYQFLRLSNWRKKNAKAMNAIWKSWGAD